MPSGRSLPRSARSIAVGAGLGFLVLGIGGRVAMALFSVLTPFPVGFTVRGSFTVALTGAIYGALAGALWNIAERWLARLPDWSRGGVFGAILFAGIGAFSVANNQASAALAYPLTTVAIFLPLTLLYGWLLTRLA